MEKVLYEELTPPEFSERLRAAPIAYLPLGTLEWHGPHLPLGADGLQSRGFFDLLAREVGGIVLPMLFVGPDRRIERDGREYYGMDMGDEDVDWHPRYPTQQLTGSAYWVPTTLFEQILDGVLKQIRRAGFKIVVGHGHGPSGTFFRDHADEYRARHGLQCFCCWGELDGGDLGIQVDHAAANETSLVMALRPELVRMQNLPSDPNAQLLGIGGRDPRTHASPDLGRRALEIQTKRMASILRQALAAA